MSKLTLLAVALFITGSYMFGMSYHNIDLAVNAKVGSIDINGWGYQQDLNTMFLNGMAGLVMCYAFFYASVLIVLVEVLVKNESKL